MNIKSEDKERWNDPAGQYDLTKFNGLQIVYFYTKEKEKEVERTVDGVKMERSVMGETISTELKKGMVIPVMGNQREEQNQETELGD